MPALQSVAPRQGPRATDARAAEAEILGTQGALARSSGGLVFLFRPPYGDRDATIDRIARAHGLLEILWTVAGSGG